MTDIKFYPRVSDIIPFSKLPDNLGFLKDGIQPLFGKLFYRDLLIDKTPDGSAAYYKLVLVSYSRLALDIPGTNGLAFVLFPAQQPGAQTEMPIRLWYQWRVLQFFDDFDPDSFVLTPRGAFDLLVQMLGVDKAGLLEQYITLFHFFDSDMIQAFVDSFPNGALTLETGQIAPYQELAEQIEGISGFDFMEFLFQNLDNVPTGQSAFDGVTVMERLLEFFERWTGPIDVDDLEEMLIPQVGADILNLPVAIEFPEYLLKRVDGNPGLSQLTFDVGQFSYSTASGFDFQQANNLWFSKSEILNTGFTLEFDTAELDLSKSENITGANQDGRPIEFLGVHIPEATIGFPESWSSADGTGEEMRLIGSDLVIGSEGGFSGLITLAGPTGGTLTRSLGPITMHIAALSMDIHQNDVESFSASGVLTIEGVSQSLATGVATGASLQEFDFTISYGTGDIYHVAVDFNNVTVVSIGGIEINLLDLQLSFDKNGIIEGSLRGSFTVPGVKVAQTGVPAVFEVLLTFSESGTTVSLTNSPQLKFCFSRDLLTPLGTGCEPILDTGVQSELWFDIGSGGIVYTTESGMEPTLSIDSVEFVHFTKSEILQTGLWLAFEDAVIDLSKQSNIEPLDSGYPDSFLGAYIQQATIGLPPSWTQDDEQSTYLQATDLIVGTEGGISGDITLVAPSGDALELNFGPVALRFNQFDMTLDHGNIESFAAGGMLAIDGVQSPDTGVSNADQPLEIAFTASYGTGDQYTIVASANQAISIGGFSALLQEVSVTFDRDGLISAHLVTTVSLDGVMEVTTGGGEQPAEFKLRLDLFEDGNVAVDLLNDPILKIVFGDYLLPVDEITCQPLTETGARSELLFSIGPNGISYATGDTGAGLSIDSLEFISFTKSEILNTGISVSFDDAEIDLSKSENIEEVAMLRPDAFIGAFIQQATFGLPSSWSATPNVSAQLIGDDLIIGTEGGFTGDITLDAITGDYLVLPFGPVEIQLHEFTTSIAQNNINSLTASGILTIAGILSADTGAQAGDLLEFPYTVDYQTGNVYTITIQNNTPATLLGGYAILISDLEVVFDNDGLISATIHASITLGDIIEVKTGPEEPVELELLIEINKDTGMDYAVTLLNSPVMKIDFSRNIFVPVDENNDPIDDVDVQAELVFGFGPGGVSWSSANGFTINSAEFISFTKSDVMDTGLIISFDGGVIDLSKVTNISQASELDDEFIGAFIHQATITLPGGMDAQTGEGGTIPMILGQELLFGNIGGFSGMLSLDGKTGETLDLKFGGAIVKLEQFSLDFEQSHLQTGSDIHGSIVIPGLKCADTGDDIEIDVDVLFLGDGAYEVTGAIPDCPMLIGSLEITLEQLTLHFDRDGLVAENTVILLNVALPSNETGGGANDIDVSLELLSDGFRLIATDTDGITFPLGPLEVTIENFFLEYRKNQPLESIIDGSVHVPTNQGGATVAVKVVLTDDGYTLDMQNVTQEPGALGFDVGGAEVILNGFFLEVERDADGEIDFVQSIITGSIELRGETLNVEVEILTDGFRVYAAALGVDGFCFDVFSWQACITEFEFIYSNIPGVKIQSSVSGSLLVPDDNGTAELEVEIDFNEQGFRFDGAAVSTTGVPIRVGGAALFLHGFIIDLDRQTDGTYELDELDVTGTLVVEASPNDIVAEVQLSITETYYELVASSDAAILNFNSFEVRPDYLRIRVSIDGGPLIPIFEIRGSVVIDGMAESDLPNAPDKEIRFELGLEEEPGGGYSYHILLDPAEYPAGPDGFPTSPIAVNMGKFIAELNFLDIHFGKQGFHSGTLTGTLKFDTDGGQKSVQLTGWVKENGFGVIGEPAQPLEFEIASFLKVSLHKVGVGKEDGHWFLQLGTPDAEITRGLDIAMLQELPLVNKFIPSGVDINSIKVYDNQSVEGADIVFHWGGMGDEKSDPESNQVGDGVEESKATNKGLKDILKIKRVSLGIKSVGNELRASFTLDGTLKIGPLAGSVEGVGIRADLIPKPDGDGSLGFLDVGKIGFKPPTGVGLTFESKAITGGGYLSFDKENERYAGVLELSIKDKISLKAVGLITTRLPDGSKGFSLLILITAEFTPIQLGLGFTLNGVGGLFGFNRGVEVEPLKEGVRKATLDNILFPENPVENAPQIISDLRAVFPPKKGGFVVGPMLLLGWGTPTLISAELGLVVSLNLSGGFSIEQLILLGVVKAVLPTEDEDTLRIQINFLGIIDFKKKAISFDASIYDSRLLEFTLQGDMIFRLKWGEDSLFLLSVGGFHPKFEPPPLDVPDLKRLGIIFFNKPGTKLSMLTYFAVTSNTVQMGARMELFKKLLFGLKISGGMGFDALFQFNPFYVLVKAEAYLNVRNRKDEAVLAVFLGLKIEGPHPWTVDGTASFEFMGKSVDVDVNIEIGKAKETTLPDIAVFPLFKKAIENPGNWSATVPANRHLLVSLKQIVAQQGETIAHPEGVLTISQKVVPLRLAISKFGTQNPVGPKTFNISRVTVGLQPFVPQDKEYLREEFAPGHFKALAVDDQLKQPSFERYDSGVTVAGSDEIQASYCVSRELQYEAYVVDEEDASTKLADATVHAIGKVGVPDFVGAAEAGGGAIATSPFSGSKIGGQLFANKVGVQSNNARSYIITDFDNLANVGGTLEFATAEEAAAALQEMIETNPALESQVQVLAQQKTNLI